MAPERKRQKPNFRKEANIMTLHLSAIDEHGYSYDAETFHTVEDAMFYIDRLEDALEDATVSESYAIRADIESLKEQLRSAIG